MNDVQATTIATTRLGWRAGYLVAAFGVFMIDQVTKAWAVRTLRVTDDLTIVRGFLDLVYTENRGIAFGQLQQLGSFGRWFFAGLAVAAALLCFLFLRTPRLTIEPGRRALLLAGMSAAD
jgi:signal peptidase II